MNKAFFDAYVECALWSSTDEEGNPLDDRFDAGDIAIETLAKMRKDCEVFCADNLDSLVLVGSDEQNGHDFWLTRNGHGAGFWDRGYGPIGDELAAACEPCGSFDLYVGDDGKVHGS